MKKTSTDRARGTKAKVKTKSSGRTQTGGAVLEAVGRVQAIIEFGPDGNVLDANPNFLKLMDYTLAEIEGRHHSMFCDAGVANTTAYRQFWERLGRGEHQSGEFRRVAKGGREVWIFASYNPIVDRQGRVERIVKLATDVTAQKQASAVHEGKVNAIGKAQAIIEFNVDGTVRTANENFCRAVGYDLGEITGRHHRMFCDPAYAASPEYAQFWDKLGRGTFDSGQYRRIGKGGREIFLEASYNPILDSENRVIMVVKFANDVTNQRKKLSEFESYVSLLERTAESLAEASKNLIQNAAQMADSSRITNDQSNSASAAAAEVATGVQVVSTSTQQMVEAIKEISRAANDSAEMSRATSNSANITNQTIAKLGESSKEIGEVIKVINSIAQQTNLLALNATIEAARAGDAGKGFAVVANEVKELAKQTAKATQDITVKIGAIQSDTVRAVDAIGDISKAIERLNNISGSIAASVEEQTATTNEVSRVVLESTRGVQSIASNIQLASRAASESQASSEQTVHASKSLAELAEQLKMVVSKVKSA